MMRRVMIGALLLAGLVLPGARAGAQSLDEPTRNALMAALDDERHAEATYSALMERFGRVRPFVNIVDAEEQHQQELLVLLERYGVPVPPRPSYTIAVPSTFRGACAVGVETEKENIAMYERFLAFVREPDIRQTFARLRDASRNHHLPAFERCLQRAGGRRGRG